MNRNGFQVIRTFFCLPFVAVIFLSTGVIYADQVDFIEVLDSGSINWTTGMVESKGAGKPLEKNNDLNPVTLNAARAAASRALLKTIKNIRIDSSETVGEYISGNDTVSAKIEDMVRNARLSSTQYLSDGTAEVVMQFNIKGGFAQLVLPDEIVQIEAVKPMQTDGKVMESGGEKLSQAPEQAYTGLIVDARGVDVDPAMKIRILSENGDEVYGAAYVSREAVVHHGMGTYVTDYDKAVLDPLVKGRPMIVKVLKSSGVRGSLVISNGDAARVQGVPEHLKFMRQCRVMVVVD